MPAAVQAYSNLNPLQLKVAQSYLAMLGRIPDAAPTSGDVNSSNFCSQPIGNGLDFWYCATLNKYGSNASISQVVDMIAGGMAGATFPPVNSVLNSDGSKISPGSKDANNNYLYNSGWGEYIEYLYTFALGRSIEDDPSGVRFWQRAAIDQNQTPGGTAQAILQAATGTAFPSSSHFDQQGSCLNLPDTFNCKYDYQFANQMLMLESAIRLQRGRGIQIAYQDLQTLLRRVSDDPVSFMNAYEKLNTLTLGGIASSCPQNGYNPDGSIRYIPCWEDPGGQPYSPSRIANESSILGGTTAAENLKQHRYLVWYNRKGRMMLAHAYLPSGYPAIQYDSVVSIHGGGWRGGFVEQLQKYNTQFIQQNNGNGPFVVFSPSYGLTSYQLEHPNGQNDIEDFIALISSNSTISRFGVGAVVHKFGVSAGGHLLNSLGFKNDYGRIATFGPVSDLTDVNNVELMRTYTDYYTNQGYKTRPQSIGGLITGKDLVSPVKFPPLNYQYYFFHWSRYAR